MKTIFSNRVVSALKLCKSNLLYTFFSFHFVTKTQYKSIVEQYSFRNIFTEILLCGTMTESHFR